MNAVHENRRPVYIMVRIKTLTLWGTREPSDIEARLHFIALAPSIPWRHRLCCNTTQSFGFCQLLRLFSWWWWTLLILFLKTLQRSAWPTWPLTIKIRSCSAHAFRRAGKFYLSWGVIWFWRIVNLIVFELTCSNTDSFEEPGDDASKCL